MLAPLYQPPPSTSTPRKGSITRLPRLHTQECPVCGRPVTVSADLQGRIVACGHCRGKFHVSVDTAGAGPTVVAREGSPSREALLERIEALLGDCRA